MNYPRGRETLLSGRDIWKWKNTIKNQEAVIDWKNSEITDLTAQVEDLERRLTSCRQELAELKEKVENQSCSTCVHNPLRSISTLR